eukprot:2084111-Prorocentrum_lima.AAC.1
MRRGDTMVGLLGLDVALAVQRHITAASVRDLLDEVALGFSTQAEGDEDEPAPPVAQGRAACKD